MSQGLVARNFESFLCELDARGHTVHVALEQGGTTGAVRATSTLERISRDRPRLTFGPLPTRDLLGLTGAGFGFRLMLDFIRYLEPGYAGADKARARAGRETPAVLRRLARRPRARAALRDALSLADEGARPTAAMRQFVRDFRPDALVVSPLVDRGSPQTDYVRCARELGVPSLLGVHSWDNLTMKGGIHEMPDRVAVWNEFQRDEAVRLQGVPPERVSITGSTAFEHWATWEPSTTRKEFCGALGLAPEDPYLLYLGSSPFIAPAEGEFLAEWSAAIRTSGNLADAQILARPHPLNPFEAQPPGVTIASPEPDDPSGEAARAAFFDAIHHSAAVVGILTSAMVEAAIIGRSVHTVLIKRYAATQRTLAHMRYLLPENGGMLVVAEDLPTHVRLLEDALAGRGAVASEEFAASFMGRSTSGASAAARLADEVETLSGAAVPDERSPARRAVAAIAAGVGWAVLRVSGRLGTHASRLSADL
jgi:hypothetical protein